MLFLTERENAAITGVHASSPDGNTKSGKNEGGRGGRKKYVTLFGVSVIHFLIDYHLCDYYHCAFQLSIS
jgi:hypothetical protein